MQEVESENKSRRGSPDRGDHLDRSLMRSGAAIQGVYNAEYDRMGKRFAMGDSKHICPFPTSCITYTFAVIAQNELQAQIIKLQQTVISILEEAVYTGKQPSRADMATLFKASEAAREGTINALKHQHKRLLETAPIRRALPPAPSAQDTAPLYCRYSFALQDDPDRPLSSAFAPGGDCKCDACGTVIPIEPNRAWQIFKEDPNTRAGERTYHILNRFIVKSHRSGGEFACVLCSRYRKVDTIWEDLKAFAKHVSRAHDSFELGREIDIKEVGDGGGRNTF